MGRALPTEFPRGVIVRRITHTVSLIVALTFVLSAQIRPGLEIGGCLTLRSYNENVRATLMENIGFFITPRVVAQVFGEQTYRNRAFINSLAGGMEYRLGPDRFQIPVGAFGGMESMVIGQYRSTTPVVGLNSGILVGLSERTWLQIRYFSRWYLDTRTIWGNDVFAGFSFLLFGKR